MKKIFTNTSLFLILVMGLSLNTYAFQTQQEKPIDKTTVQQGAKLMGLEFTNPEIDSMMNGIRNQIQQFNSNRGIKLDNSIPPALYFNPLPTGFIISKASNSFKAGKIGRVMMPKNENDLAFYTVRQLAVLIETRQITSEKLTRFFIKRLKKYDTKLKCVITLTEDLAIKQAKQADQEIEKGRYRGILHGIPYGAKDLLAKEGYKTTWGAKPYKDQTINKDATVIQRLEKAGAVLVAKLTLGALAWGDVWFGGTTRNPWNTKQGSSGSSAGSASAVAAGLVPFAIGTETLGSIVSPSTRCGVTGLRPTYGRISRTGAMALSWTMDKIGPMTRSVEDLAIVFKAIHGKDSKDLSLFDAPFVYNGNQTVAQMKKTIKVGYVKNFFDRKYGFKAYDEATLKKMKEIGFELVPVELPQLPQISFILWAEAATAFDELTRSNRDDMLVRQIKQAWPNYFRMARFVPAVEYLQANRLRTVLIEQMHEKLKNIDVFLAPSFVGSTLTMTNLSGHPCVVLPNGFTPQGTPTSITFIGKLFGEGKLLQVAKAYQEATNFHKKHPDWVKK
ncbi:MAG TPA: amidase [Microscillaceae bacterium]|nr:amidase [Microscillaceae bacterium]